MSVIDPAATQSLEARVRALEAENRRLTARSLDRPTGSRGRAFASALCIIVAAILVPISIVGAWTRVQLVEEDAFVATLAPLVDDPAVQSLMIDETMGAINQQVDFSQLTASIFDGIADLGLPPRAVQALGLLQAPAADGLENLVNQTVTNVVESDAFSDVWATATRAAHRALTTAATSDGGGLVVRTSDGVGIQLGAIVDQVKQNLVDRGVGVAALIPSVDRVIIIGEGNTLTAIRTGYAIAATVGWWLPVITLALFGLGILVARRRSTAVLGTGLGVAIGGGALAATLSIGSSAVGIAAGSLDLSAAALGVIYAQLVGAMSQTAVVFAVLGLVIAVIGWLMGSSRGAVGVRAATEGLNSSARAQLAARGLHTGSFGAWLGRHRVLVRVVIAVLSVAWLFSLRPLSFGDVLLVLVLALLVGWVLELLQQPDADPDAETSTMDASASSFAALEEPASARPSKERAPKS